jgi:hypothetical protein
MLIKHLYHGRTFLLDLVPYRTKLAVQTGGIGGITAMDREDLSEANII